MLNFLHIPVRLILRQAPTWALIPSLLFPQGILQPTGWSPLLIISYPHLSKIKSWRSCNRHLGKVITGFSQSHHTYTLVISPDHSTTLANIKQTSLHLSSHSLWPHDPPLYHFSLVLNHMPLPIIWQKSITCNWVDQLKNFYTYSHSTKFF